MYLYVVIMVPITIHGRKEENNARFHEKLIKGRKNVRFHGKIIKKRKKNVRFHGKITKKEKKI